MVQRLKGVPQGFKHCYKCDRVLPESSFSHSKAQKDGLQTACKECRQKEKVLYYHKHPERQFLHKHPERRKKYLEKIPERNTARQRAWRKVPLGSKCEICQSTENLQRHHFDYSKPLDVHTFCPSCHQFVHVVLRKMKKNPLDPKLVYLLFGKEKVTFT